MGNFHFINVGTLPEILAAGETLHRNEKKELFTAACIAPEPQVDVPGHGVVVLVEVLGPQLELQGPPDSLLRGRVAHGVDIES